MPAPPRRITCTRPTWRKISRQPVSSRCPPKFHSKRRLDADNPAGCPGGREAAAYCLPPSLMWLNSNLSTVPHALSSRTANWALTSTRSPPPSRLVPVRQLCKRFRSGLVGLYAGLAPKQVLFRQPISRIVVNDPLGIGGVCHAPRNTDHRVTLRRILRCVC